MCIRDSFETYPEEAPVVLLDVLSRKYKKSESAMDLLPNVSKICRLSDEVKLELIAMFVPSITKPVAMRMKKAMYAGSGPDPDIITKLFMWLFEETKDEGMVTRDRKLLLDMLRYKRSNFMNSRLPSIQPDFTMQLYLFELVDLEGDEEPQRYMSIQHIDGTKATIPKTIVC
eukprot:11220120-Lingulodinium_polyedra.AAC.1